MSIRILPGEEVTLPIVGVTFEGRQEIIKSLEVGDTIFLEHESDNEHDPNAVAALTENEEKIGYIAKEVASKLSHFIDKYTTGDKRIYATIDGFSHVNPPVIGVRIRFTVPSLDSLQEDENYGAWADEVYRNLSKPAPAIATRTVPLHIHSPTLAAPSEPTAQPKSSALVPAFLLCGVLLAMYISWRLGSDYWFRIVATPDLEFRTFVNLFLTQEGAPLFMVAGIGFMVGLAYGARKW